MKSASDSWTSRDMPTTTRRSLYYRMRYYLSGYRVVAIVLMLFLLFGLVARAWADFSLGRLFYSLGVESTVSYPMKDLQHGIMFDAGSTGSRIHVFSFRKLPDGALHLEKELFEEKKPGLSAFADRPEKGAHTIYQLLQRAKDIIPPHLWHVTPVALKATAGLRLLPSKAAKNLLKEVYKVFQASPFDVPTHQPHCVSIMDGLDEGIFAWVTVNFLTGSFNKDKDSLMGALDLGGGSTQVTFHPLTKATISNSPKGFTQSVGVFGHKNTLYSHSYLGLGLMSARAAMMSQGTYKTLAEGSNISHSPCLPPDHQDEWSFGGRINHIRGHQSYSFDACMAHASKLVKKVNKNDEMNLRTFYTFSYYYDRAAELGLIDKETGGIISVGDYRKKATEACTSREARSNKLLCMDVTYIIALLQHGYGFEDDRKLILRKKINGVEVSWALGATLDMFDKRSRRKH